MALGSCALIPGHMRRLQRWIGDDLSRRLFSGAVGTPVVYLGHWVCVCESERVFVLRTPVTGCLEEAEVEAICGAAVAETSFSR